MIRKRVSLLTLFLVTCFVFPMLSLGSQTFFVISNGEAWSDDFDDGEITGWTVDGYNMSEVPPSPLPGNFTSDDHTLRAFGEEWNHAYHVSTVTAGSWTFDLHCNRIQSNHFYIAFISSPSRMNIDYLSDPYELGLMPIIGEYDFLDHAFALYAKTPGNTLIDILAVYDAPQIDGWYHIKITRNSEGRIEVFFNGTSRITYVYQTVSTSEFFSFFTEAGNAIDNIVVEQSPPKPPELPNPQNPSITLTSNQITLILIVIEAISLVVTAAIIDNFRYYDNLRK